MRDIHSDPPSSATGPPGWILAFDTGHARVSLAVGRAGTRAEHVTARAVLPQRRTAEALLRTAEMLLLDVGCGFADLAGVVALAGPGSFTGLRIGLATALGLHQGLGLPATAVPTLALLARTVGPDEAASAERPIIAAVDALRGAFMARGFAPADGMPRPIGDALRGDAAAIAARWPRAGVLATLADAPSADALRDAWPADARPTARAPSSLAALAVEAAGDADFAWDPGRLIAPVYFRPPGVTAPAAPKTVAPAPTPARS